VAYLGHVISAEGAAMDENKVKSVLAWPVSASVQAVRAFLKLAGYYRRFIWDFSAIATPLTKLLYKECFKWTTEVEDSFHVLQRALTTALVLRLPMFDKEFIVDYDASGSGIGVILHYGEGDVAFFSRQMAPCHSGLAAYERELLGLVQVVCH
jgi:hypothetical protein